MEEPSDLPEIGYETSPVPSDADLWPGELPFTAWGQYEHGSLDLRVFDQDVYWVDIAQVPHELDQMSDDYIANVIGFLEREASYFHTQTMLRMAIQVVGDLELGRLPGDLLAEAIGAPRLDELTPAEWLEATPLIRALRARQR
jgi:hypothetical protein